MSQKELIMGYKILRFFGALLAVNAFIYLVELFHLFCMVGLIEFFENFSWRSLFTLGIIRGFVIPIAWIIFYGISIGIAWLVRGSRIIAALPLISFVIAAIALFIKLFISPSNVVLDEVDSESWYYIASVIAYLVIIGWFIFCSILMFAFKDEK